MSDEYSVTTNFQRASGDPRAADEYEHRMLRVREREADLEALKWWEMRLVCTGCGKAAYRTPKSVNPCQWCGEGLVAA